MYQDLKQKLAVINDENRLRIIDMLSCKPMTNTLLLEFLNISQPTLSHHLKILEQNEFITRSNNSHNKEYYLNQEKFKEIIEQITIMSMSKDDCICFKKEK